MSTDDDALAALRGATLIATDTEVGEVEEVYAYAGEDRPALALVSADAGLVLVPVNDADVEDDVITVGFAPDVVETAPSPSGEQLTEDEFEAVYAHYGVSDADLRDQSHP
jgi:hypothetical protein